MKRGLLISFEGLDGSGKGTAIVGVKAHLESLGHEVQVLREPGGTSLGEELRAVLLNDPERLIDDRAEALIFAAVRAQNAFEVYRPALERGVVMIVDRCVHSSLAYQGHARGLGMEAVAGLSRFALDGLWPDRTLLLSVSETEATRRRHGRDGELADRIEAQGSAFMQRAEQGYALCAEFDPRTVRLVDADGTPAEVVACCIAALADLFVPGSLGLQPPAELDLDEPAPLELSLWRS